MEASPPGAVEAAPPRAGGGALPSSAGERALLGRFAEAFEAGDMFFGLPRTLPA